MDDKENGDVKQSKDEKQGKSNKVTKKKKKTKARGNFLFTMNNICTNVRPNLTNVTDLSGTLTHNLLHLCSN